MTAMYPLLLTPILKPKVWGGTRLAKLGKPLPAGVAVGESWELADLATTSASGGGGDAAQSVIENGALKGQTLHDAMNQWGERLLGKTKPTPTGHFPLLAKFLDAREHLSVQVHPSQNYARAHSDAHLKTECWTIVDAVPGSKLFVGIRPGVTRDMLAAHIQGGTVAEDLIAIDARVGDTHLLPSGTCHALGAGVLVAEVQTPSDTTFRVYDWTAEYNRPQRELHIEQALECIDFGQAPAPARLEPGQQEGRVVTTEYFTLDEVLVNCQLKSVAHSGAGAEGDRPVVLMVLSGFGSVQHTTGGIEEVGFRPGTTLLVPASIAKQCQIAAGPQTRILRATVL